MVRALVDVPRWLFLATLIYAPCAFGCTRTWAIHVLNALMGAILLLWLLECALRRRLPRVHPVCVAAVVLLVALGWWMGINAHYKCDEHFRFTVITPLWRGAPGGVDRQTVIESMLRMTGLL